MWTVLRIHMDTFGSVKHLLLLFLLLLLQGGSVGQEFAEVERADSEGKPPGARSLFYIG